MPRITRSLPRLLLWIVLFAVMAAKASGAHVHLCMDGYEPPASVHFSDSHNDEHHLDDGGSDKDVNPLIGMMAKKAGSDFDLGLAVVVAVLSWDLPVASVVSFPPERPAIPADFSLHYRPPLRGPPV